jgi:DNA-binding CsgD family transcriptional regulator
MDPWQLSAAVVASIGATDFGRAALQGLHSQLPLGAWTVYRVHDQALPELEVAASLGPHDMTGACFALYRGGLYQADRSFDAVRRVCNADVTPLLRLCPASLSAEHRSRIYEDHRLQQRMSLVARDTPTSLLALNFYRFCGQPRFNEGEERCLAQAGPVLVAAVRKHLALRPAAPVGGSMAPAVQAEAAVRGRLRDRCPRLTERELQVCSAIVQGWTFDGIAADLQVSAATVKTYRDRAFRRLGIHHRNQLYGMCMGHGWPAAAGAKG